MQEKKYNHVWVLQCAYSPCFPIVPRSDSKSFSSHTIALADSLHNHSSHYFCHHLLFAPDPVPCSSLCVGVFTQTYLHGAYTSWLKVSSRSASSCPFSTMIVFNTRNHSVCMHAPTTQIHRIKWVKKITIENYEWVESTMHTYTFSSSMNIFFLIPTSGV